MSDDSRTLLIALKTLPRKTRRTVLRGLVEHRINSFASPTGQPIEPDVLARLGEMVASGELDKEKS